MYQLQRSTTRPLIGLLVISAILFIVGFIFVYSSSSIYALDRYGSPHYFVFKQLTGFVLGLAGMIIIRLIPLALIKKTAPLIFVGSLLVTALTLIPGLGISIHGSRRWISILKFTFQPSDLLKISLILYLAYILTKKHYSLNSFWYSYLPFLCILTAVAAVLLKQPDFGQMVTTCSMAFLLFFLARINTKHLIATIVPLIPITAMLIYFKPYRFKRILVFLNPWKDPQGSGFQIIQSLIAIGSGGLGGVGIANSKQKYFYLPMQHTDFIFSIIAEETGFIGSCLLIMLYILFLYYGLKLTHQLKDQFSAYVVLGFVLLISIQAAVNIAVATSLLPTKGIGLPFISYGRSALICDMWMLGIIMNCVQADPTDTPLNRPIPG